MPRKTSADNPADWLWIAASDLDLLQAASEREVGFVAARSKLAEALEKILKAELIRLGWALVKTHDLVFLAKELRGEQIPDPHERLKKNMYVYRQADLDMLYEDMEQFWWAAFYFNGYLRRPNDPGRQSDLKKLREFSQVKAALKA